MDRAAQRTVVVVDDAAEVRGLVRTQLRMSDRFVVVAEGRTGSDAVELCTEHQPDVVLLDVSMPDMDGLEALPRIRKVAPKTRVVMYTGFQETGLAERARELGAVALLEKSTAVARLADELAHICDVTEEDSAGPRTLVLPEHEDLADAGDAVLADHLERFRELFEEAAIGMATMTLTGRVVRANEALAELVGRPVASLVGVPFTELVPDADRTRVLEALHRSQVGAGEVVQAEHGVLGDPDERRVLSTAAPVRDARGRPLYLFLQSQDVTAQRRAEEELRQSEQRFRLLVEAVQDYAIFMLDPQGHIVSWNRGAERIKGYRSDEIIGQHFRVFYPKHMQDVHHPEKELELARAHGVYEEEGWRVRKDGSVFWASVVITAVYDQQGRHIGFAKVTRDIEERRKLLLDAEDAARNLAGMNDELEAANERLERRAADQAQFLAVTAHELRSPISVLAGSAQLLVDHLDDLTAEEREELAESITASAGRLQRMIRDLLTAARIEAGVVRLEVQDVDLSELLARTVAAARAALPDATIELDVPPGLAVRGEPDRLGQVVENLINNGVRHGAPPVTVRARDRGDRVELEVSDTGAGVSAEIVPRLFSRFATGARTRGTGLGLFIVRELIRAHGGDASYLIAEDGRPTFRLWLPKPSDADGPSMP